MICIFVMYQAFEEKKKKTNRKRLPYRIKVNIVEFSHFCWRIKIFSLKNICAISNYNAFNILMKTVNCRTKRYKFNWLWNEFFFILQFDHINALRQIVSSFSGSLSNEHLSSILYFILDSKCFIFRKAKNLLQ